MKLTKLVVTVGTAVLATAAIAMPTMTGVFKDTYKPAADSEVAKAGCATCHVAKSVKYNPYGEDLKKAMAEAKTKKLTADVLKKVEALDSDKDGAKNIDEIKAGTLPGDKASSPKK